MSTSSSSKPSSSRRARTCARARSHRWQSAAPYRTTRLGIQTPGRQRLRDPLDAEPVGGEPHRRLSLLRDLPRLVERLRDDLVQPPVDLVLLPEVLLEALHPLEVRDDD